MRPSVEIRSSTAICSMPHRSLPSLQRDARYFRIQPVDDGYPALCHPHPASQVSCFQSGKRTSEGRRRYRWLFGDLTEVGVLISSVDDAPCIQLGIVGPLLSDDDRWNGANGAKDGGDGQLPCRRWSCSRSRSCLGVALFVPLQAVTVQWHRPSCLPCIHATPADSFQADQVCRGAEQSRACAPKRRHP